MYIFSQFFTQARCGRPLNDTKLTYFGSYTTVSFDVLGIQSVPITGTPGVKQNNHIGLESAVKLLLRIGFPQLLRV